MDVTITLRDYRKPLRSPFTIFVEYRIRLGKVQNEKPELFRFVSALASHYICKI